MLQLSVLKSNNMKKIILPLLTLALFCTTLFSCKQSSNTIATEADSLSYVIGLSVGQSLIKLDSTLNVDAVCQGIRDVYNSTQMMTMDEGRDYYLGQQTYFVHEKAEKYQEGSIISGTIIKLTDFGAFMEIEPGFDGLIPMGELAAKRINRADEAVELKQEVQVKILHIDVKRKRISLSITKANTEAE